jgi:hypothetical protein
MICWRDVFLCVTYVFFAVYALYVDASHRNSAQISDARDVVYPARSYHSPLIGKLIDRQVDPNSSRRMFPLTRTVEPTENSLNKHACMRRLIDTMMDRLLSIRRADFNANSGHYKE